MEEKIITLNLRKKIIEASRWKRKPKTVRLLRKIIMNRTKAKKVAIDNKLNESIWKLKKNKIRIKMIKLDDGSVRLEKI